MNKAQFPSPPGGELVCPKGYTPFIETDTSGKIVASCEDIRDDPSPTGIVKVILSKVKGYRLSNDYNFNSTDIEL